MDMYHCQLIILNGNEINFLHCWLICKHYRFKEHHCIQCSVQNYTKQIIYHCAKKFPPKYSEQKIIMYNYFHYIDTIKVKFKVSSSPKIQGLLNFLVNVNSFVVTKCLGFSQNIRAINIQSEPTADQNIVSTHHPTVVYARGWLLIAD